MKSPPSVLVLGGGLSGVAAACELVRLGLPQVTLLEAGDSLGGLAGSFNQDGRFYPLGYHHILHRDATLLEVLRTLGVHEQVLWRPVHINFFEDGRLHDLSSPLGFARYPMSLADKARFTRLMLRAFRKHDWSDWEGRNAAELIDAWAGPGVREAIFEPLCRIRFELPCREISAAWLGARLYHREGSARLGYIPGTNWTRVLCDGLARMAKDLGVQVRLSSRVDHLEVSDGRVTAAVTGNERVETDLVVSTLPTEVYQKLLPGDATPGLDSIRYTALISVICASRHRLPEKLYWVSLTEPGHTASGIFQLNALNPTIGVPGHGCINFVSHLLDRNRPLFNMPDSELISLYLADFKAVFGFDLDPYWIKVNRVPMYAPAMRVGFRNIQRQSSTHENVYFAGNYRTFPSILSTGTAMSSGFTTARTLHAELAARGDAC